MGARSFDRTKIEHLRGLESQPELQAECAADLVERETRIDILLPALSVLGRLPHPEAHDLLVRKYEHLDSDGGKRDQGCHIRVGLVDALSPVAVVDDIALFERATWTVEFLPPGRSEVAGGLRAAGVVALALMDPELAAFHAARLLHDPYVSEMSGEPGRTCARLLGMQERMVPLYQYLFSPEPNPDVAGECLRQASELPDSVLGSLVERFHDHDSAIVRIGLLDLLLENADAHGAQQAVDDMIRNDPDPEVFHYAVTAVAASRHERLVDSMLRLADREIDYERLRSLCDALALLPGSPKIREAAAIVDGKLDERRNR